jgi:sec-independent protein translocase protein TatB
MFDIGWSELVVIAVVALIAIGPKELPGVLRMVGQWMGKARKMAAEFQGQFQEAMREAEMADLKKSFDEVKEAATGFTGGNIMSSLQKDVSESLRIDDIDKPAISTDTPAISPDGAAISNSDTPAISNSDTPAVAEAAHPGIDLPAHPTTPEAPTPATSAEADAHVAAAEPVAKDAKAS